MRPVTIIIILYYLCTMCIYLATYIHTHIYVETLLSFQHNCKYQQKNSIDAQSCPCTTTHQQTLSNDEWNHFRIYRKNLLHIPLRLIKLDCVYQLIVLQINSWKELDGKILAIVHLHQKGLEEHQD